MLMFDCKLTPTPIQVSDSTNIPSPLTTFTNTFYLQYFHCKYIGVQILTWIQCLKKFLLNKHHLKAQNNCIAINNTYWRNINDTQTGVATKSYQVHGMFIAYLVENSLWFVLSVLLFFGMYISHIWYDLYPLPKYIPIASPRWLNQIQMAVCDVPGNSVYSHDLRCHSYHLIFARFQELQSKPTTNVTAVTWND